MILRANLAIGWGLIFLVTGTLGAQQTQKSTDPQLVCNEAKSQMELNQCAGEQYRKADARLNAAYRKLLEIMQKDLSRTLHDDDAELARYNQQAIEKLKAAEKAWIQYRDLHCDAASHQYQGGSMSPMIRGFCMAETTLDRIKELKSAYEDGDRKLE